MRSSYGIKILGIADGSPTGIEGRWLSFYDLTGRGGRGVIKTTENPKLALRFKDAAEAVTVYRQAYGTRSDGLPNRPLTAYTVEIAPLPSIEESSDALRAESQP